MKTWHPSSTQTGDTPSTPFCNIISIIRATVLALNYAPPKGILSGASRPRTPARGVSPVGYHLGYPKPINPCFDYHIRDQRGRFTPGGFVLEEFF